MNNKRRLGIETAVLSFVRIVTILVNLIQTMILSRTLTKIQYGTYSQTLLVVQFCVVFFSLGLENTINYFYNSTYNEIKRKNYINTIFSISLISGFVAAVFLVLFSRRISIGFGNSDITILIIIISLRPLLQNVIALYQPLFISCGNAGLIAFVNLAISVLQVALISFLSIKFKDLRLIFGLTLCLDILQLLCFSGIFKKLHTKIRIVNIRNNYSIKILKYSIPLIIASSVSILFTNMDKLVISGNMSIEDYALYSNMARELPLTFITNAMTTVFTPLVIRYINDNEIDKFKDLWSKYLEIGYLLLWPFCVSVITLAPEFISFLYSEQYLCKEGVQVFAIYNILLMFRFTYFGLIPTAKGRTDVIMKYSIIMCLLNAVLNYPLFKIMGMSGPAVASVLSMAISVYLYFRISIKLVNLRIVEIFSIKKVLFTLFELIIIASVIRIIVNMMGIFLKKNIVVLIIGEIMFCVCFYGLNFNRIKKIIKSMN